MGITFSVQESGADLLKDHKGMPMSEPFIAPLGEVRATAASGGQKGRKEAEYALIPVRALREIARVYGYGAGKYAPHNWRRGYPYSWSYSALQRHLNAFWAGESLDQESGLPHLAHAGFHVLTLLTYSIFSLGEDDRVPECVVQK